MSFFTPNGTTGFARHSDETRIYLEPNSDESQEVAESVLSRGQHHAVRQRERKQQGASDVHKRTTARGNTTVPGRIKTVSPFSVVLKTYHLSWCALQRMTETL